MLSCLQEHPMTRHAIHSHHGSRAGQRFAAAVVMPTLLRPTLLRAVQSVYDQDALGALQLLIGIDTKAGDPALLEQIVALKPDNWVLTICDLGYSTAVRNGGIYPAGDGGSLRTILSYAANSPFVAYLDDDNWWAPDHLSSLLRAIAGAQWAFSLRWFVDEATQQPLAVDSWESVGPGRGVYQKKFGGFVDPSTLLIDKIACEPVLRWWCQPLPGDPRAMSADRQVFNLLRHYKCQGSGKPTCFYTMQSSDGMHSSRMRQIRKRPVKTTVAAPGMLRACFARPMLWRYLVCLPVDLVIRTRSVSGAPTSNVGSSVVCPSAPTAAATSWPRRPFIAGGERWPNATPTPASTRPQTLLPSSPCTSPPNLPPPRRASKSSWATADACSLGQASMPPPCVLCWLSWRRGHAPPDTTRTHFSLPGRRRLPQIV